MHIFMTVLNKMCFNVVTRNALQVHSHIMKVHAIKHLVKKCPCFQCYREMLSFQGVKKIWVPLLTIKLFHLIFMLMDCMSWCDQ